MCTVIFTDGDCASLDLVRPPGVVSDHLDNEPNVARRVTERLPVVQRLQTL